MATTLENGLYVLDIENQNCLTIEFACQCNVPQYLTNLNLPVLEPCSSSADSLTTLTLFPADA
jgi:hypothetical protein